MASIRRLPSGKWQAQFRPIPGGRQITKTTTKKIEAQRWLDHQAAALVTGSYVDPHAGKVTFEDYYERWARRQVWTGGTQLAMNLAARSVPFGNVPMRLLTRAHVELWVKDMQSQDRGADRPKGLAPGTIRTRFNNVRSVLRGAVKDRVIAGDPSEGVRLPRTRRAESAMRLPTVNEVASLLASSTATFRTFVALCAFAGLRLGEAAALQVHDVDFAQRRILVRRQVQRASGEHVEIRAPKYGSERVVFLADGLADTLRAHLAALPGEGAERWLFRGERGDPPHQNTVGYWWRKTQRLAGCTGLKLHDLRHFYASGLIANGCDVVTVQRALGHSSPSITLNTYAHLWPTAEDRTRAAASLLYSQVLRTADEHLTNGDAA